MSSYLSERLALCGTIDPDSYGAGSYPSDAVSMQRFERAVFILAVGTLGAGGTVDLKLQQSDTAGGTFTDLAGKAIDQLQQASGDDDKQAVVEVRADELSVGNSYVRGMVTVGTASCYVALISLGGDARFVPSADQELSSLAQTVR